MLSLGSMYTDQVTVKLCYNEVIYNSQIINLGATTWLCYIQNPTIVSFVIMRLNCISKHNVYRKIPGELEGRAVA